MITNEEIAKICHEANRAYCWAVGHKIPLPWNSEDMSIRNSCLDSVNNFMENPEFTPAQMHDKWCEYKRSDGWIYGPEKSIDKKTHPCLKPYKDLPDEQKIKDRLFINICAAFLQRD